MAANNFFRELDQNLDNWFTPIVKWVIYLCVGVFLLELFIPQPIIYLLGAHADTAIFRGWVWQFFTYAFVHGGVWHMAFNLFALWMFGTRLEQRWGSDSFLRFVFVTAVGAVAVHMVVTVLATLSTHQPYTRIPIIGFSGVVFGVLLVYALNWPDDIVYLNFILPMKVKYWVAILGLMTLLSASNLDTPVANLTHLGGLLFGYLFVKFPRVFDRIPIPRFISRTYRSRERWRDF
jgi:membrane associated rhomboid family serine protease